MDTLLTAEQFAKALETARRPEHGSLHPFSLAWSRMKAHCRRSIQCWWTRCTRWA